ncbi:MAG TPA: hypothetical protein VMQ50_06260 [Casimicrobiaceae bacterium]|nr:hypothetical protein [Casimicrobiaceae bacterium]
MAAPRLRKLLPAAVIALLAVSTAAEAQWVLLARRAVGRVEQMSQTQPDGPSYDSAAVMLEAPADKVYAAVVSGVKKKEGITVTREDASERLIQFTNGQQIAGIKVSPLGDDLSHLLISSAHSGSQPNAAQLVSDSVLRVCADMNVVCSRAQQ